MTSAEIANLKAAVTQAAEEARDAGERNVFRTQTDFIGRIADCFWTIDGLHDASAEGIVEADDREEAVQALTSLAGLCVGLVAMLRTPEPAAALTVP